MPDLHTIVQRMVDGGESEDDIASVIKHYTLYDPNRKPVSAEDFTDPNAGIQAPTLSGFLRKTGGALVDTVKGLAATAQEMRPEDAAFGPMAALAPFARAAAGGAVSEARKAAAAPTVSETIGHGAAAALPFVGPAAAHAGERFGSGDVEGGLAETAALLGPAAAAKLAPRVAPPLASIGEQIAAKGRAVVPIAKMVGSTALEAAPQMALDTGLSLATGHPVPPVMTAVKVAQTIANRVKEAKIAKAAAAEAETAAAVKAAAEAARIAKLKATAKLADTPEAFTARGGAHKTAAPPTRASTIQALSDALDEVNAPVLPDSVELPPPPELPPGYEPRTTVPTPRPAPEVGTLVRDASGAPVKAPTLSQMLADSLAEAERPEPPARVTTAPPAALPPGYTPRSTVPKPRRLTPVEAAKVAEERTPEPVRKRAYFLKPEAKAAPVEAVEPTGRVEVADLPESWRARTGSEPIDPQGVAGEQAAAQFAQELRARGMSIGEAVMRVSQNKALPTGVRLQIIDTLKKSARMAAVNR